jgi:CubicO group peptidase (beta-lactamase class C family)
MKDEKLIYAKGYGWADKERGEWAEVKHIFRIASLSKLITGAAVMKLCEEGKIDLSDRPFATGATLDLPQFSSIKDSRIRNITIDQLLRHKAGFSNRGGDPMFNLSLISKRLNLNREAETDEIISYSLNQRLSYNPGHGTRYSNLGYLILSRLIEVVSGLEYEDYVKEHIFKPAGVYDIHLAKNYYDERYINEVKYYEPRDEELIESYKGDGSMMQRCYGGNNIRGLLGAGAWVASPSELLKLIAALDGRDNVPDILTKESVRIMTNSTPTTLPIGWAKCTSSGDWSRTGTLSGTSALLKYSRDGFSWVFVTNTSSWKGSTFPRQIDALFRNAFKRVPLWPERDLFDY